MKPSFLRSALLTCLVCLPSIGLAGDLKPRAEVNVRAGTERSILMTEFWAPLAQQSDRVLFGDLRLMGDNDDNREGNLGFGYRQISKKTNSVLGGNVWIDRRRTENGNNFHQLTLGVESLGDNIDLRANGYIQLNSSKTKITPNIGIANPYLAGTGIFYDTNGFIVEEPQDGFDAEVGYRLPVLQKHIDATRVYAGGYHFWGNTTDNVTGFRIRTEAQVNSIFSVGARFQHDGPRGSQGFLEATLRFPFKSKKLYQEHGLRSRLDESPERDIDIVTGTKVDTGLMKPVVNAAGTVQRVLYVDNTNTSAGDGSKENPFNTLAAAQSALQANDIVYVFRGDGTTTGMDQGFVLDKKGVSMIGSGSALSYAGFTLLNAGLAPVITNIQATTSEYTGNGVLITKSDTAVSGITITGSTLQGLAIVSAAGETIENIHISNVSALANKVDGIKIGSRGDISNVLIENSISSGNRIGVYLIGLESGSISNIRLSNLTSTNNTSIGAYFYLQNDATMDNIVVDGLTASNNVSRGLYILNSSTGAYGTVSLNNVTVNNNTSDGIVVSTGAVNSIDHIILTNSTINNNGSNGIYFNATSGGTFNRVTVDNVISQNNTLNGILFNTQSSGSMGNITLSNYTGSNNKDNGLQVTSQTNGAFGTVSLLNTVTNNNTNTGIVFQNTASIISQININNATSNNNATREGIRIQMNSGTVISNVFINNVITNGNKTYGLYFYGNGGTATTTNISNVTSENNISHGVYLLSTTSSVFNTTTLSNITTRNNRDAGLYIYGTSVGKFDSIVANNITATGNMTYGLMLHTNNASSTIGSFSLSNSTFSGNTTHGVYIYKQVAGAIMNIDLGGGSTGSTGQNRIFSNTGNDIRVNYIDGGTVSARNNWWGVATAPTRVTLSASTTLDSAGYLTADPRP